MKVYLDFVVNIWINKSFICPKDTSAAALLKDVAALQDSRFSYDFKWDADKLRGASH